GRRLGELGHPVHAVVIGDGQRLEAERGRLGDQIVGAGRSVEEAVRRMAVQLGPGRLRTGGTDVADPGSRQASDRTRPGTVPLAAVWPAGPGALAALVSPGETPLELVPRERRV